jgi:flagellum-specific ATP synthase
MSLVDVESVRRSWAGTHPYVVKGRVTRASGMIVHATLPGVSLGTACDIEIGGGGTVSCDVVGFDGQTVLLMPVGEVHGIAEGALVVPRRDGAHVRPSLGLLGRVVDANLAPLDGLGAVDDEEAASLPLKNDAPDAMQRTRISRPLETGIRVIDTLLTLGEGQRVAIMAGAGVGKSMLLGMLARAEEPDVVVVGLVGERGREVREFVERDLGVEGRMKSVVITATSDTPPMTRVRASLAATTVAEYFRDRGMRVLLLMDSLTRYAMALREIGLSAGEPPTSKGYPPSVFSAIPRLVERTGYGLDPVGSITAIYTVLAEGDDLADPVADTARATLDGHWVLSRRLAGAGHFPAIDVVQSVSRVMTDISTPQEIEVGRHARELLGAYEEARDLVEVGAYVAGSNPRTDRALRCRDALQNFLRQRPTERTPRERALVSLRQVLEGGG